jgi:hypothetical protein
VDQKRCGTCALLQRADNSALTTFGKCPHREGWVRTFQEACERHAGEPQAAWVTVAKVANTMVAFLSLAFGVYWDVRKGSMLTHVLLGLLSIGFLYMLWFAFGRSSAADEEAKYLIFDIKDEEPKDDREDFRF